jgi:hypothetical protein
LLSVVHAVAAALKPSTGQLTELPLQVSDTSHSPAEARQVVLVPRKTSVGQTVEVPVHLSSESHTPAAARQAVPALPAGC